MKQLWIVYLYVQTFEINCFLILYQRFACPHIANVTRWTDVSSWRKVTFRCGDKFWFCRDCHCYLENCPFHVICDIHKDEEPGQVHQLVIDKKTCTKNKGIWFYSLK